MTMSEFYAQRVSECQADAARATLDQVKGRALRAQASWQKLLDQEELHVAIRNMAAAAKKAGD